MVTQYTQYPESGSVPVFLDRNRNPGYDVVPANLSCAGEAVLNRPSIVASNRSATALASPIAVNNKRANRVSLITSRSLFDIHEPGLEIEHQYQQYERDHLQPYGSAHVRSAPTAQYHGRLADRVARRAILDAQRSDVIYGSLDCVSHAHRSPVVLVRAARATVSARDRRRIDQEGKESRQSLAEQAQIVPPRAPIAHLGAQRHQAAVEVHSAEAEKERYPADRRSALDVAVSDRRRSRPAQTRHRLSRQLEQKGKCDLSRAVRQPGGLPTRCLRVDGVICVPDRHTYRIWLCIRSRLSTLLYRRIAARSDRTLFALRCAREQAVLDPHRYSTTISLINPHGAAISSWAPIKSSSKSSIRAGTGLAGRSSFGAVHWIW
jgi:hypothetical protein